MSLDVVRGATAKPVAAQHLEGTLSGGIAHWGTLMIGFPVIGSDEFSTAMDAMLVSDTYGVVVFDLVEGASLGDYRTRQEDAARLVRSHLLQSRQLSKKGILQVTVEVITFAPAIMDLPVDTDYIVTNDAALVGELDCLRRQHDPEVIRATLSFLQSISTIRAAGTPRRVVDPQSRGGKLSTLENSIATLDLTQSKSVFETTDGVQRIRGLAGSGKTIVLALKAAYLHVTFPDWTIAVTFNTRSLKEQFRKHIADFVIKMARREPDWDRLRILNAWGGRGGGSRSGLYSEFCQDLRIEYLDYQSARDRYGRNQAFDGACQAALQEMTAGPNRPFDAILVDEAQDFPSSFLRLCYEYLDEHKRLVYAYDELQTLHGESLPSPEEIFGIDGRKRPRVTLKQRPGDGGARRDIVLEKCYRNSRPVLVSAHSLGFGIYHPKTQYNPVGLVQMFNRPGLWGEIGYETLEGQLDEGHRVVLGRTEETSPGFLERHSSVDDLVRLEVFESKEAQDEWVATEIRKNLEEDELRFEDIVVINPDGITARRNLAPIRRLLLEMGISSHLAGVDTSEDVFFAEGTKSVTFTGIYRAKGNEAGMVYVVNANECDFVGPNLARARNALFTAMTRSKAWVRVAGHGPSMDRIAHEFEVTKEEGFTLRFKYPTPEEQIHIKMLHRDVSADVQSDIQKSNAAIRDALGKVRSGRIEPSDLDPETLLELLTLLKGHDDPSGHEQES